MGLRVTVLDKTIEVGQAMSLAVGDAVGAR